jgi:type I site-specific restriction endonuclease
MTSEARARQTIDALLTAAGWHVCNVANANLHAGSGAVKGVAIREFPLNPGHGFADYLLYVNGKACGVIEAKKEGATLSGVEVQSARYAQGLPAALPAWRRPLPFVFESTGVETRFTNGLDPAPRARPLFAFFQPELLLKMSPVIATLIDRVAVGCGVKHLRVGGVERFPIPLPPQKSVDAEVDANFQRSGSLRAAIPSGTFQPGH